MNFRLRKLKYTFDCCNGQFISLTWIISIGVATRCSGCGADYAHHITASPPGFKKLSTSLISDFQGHFSKSKISSILLIFFVRILNFEAKYRYTYTFLKSTKKLQRQKSVIPWGHRQIKQQFKDFLLQELSRFKDTFADIYL